MKITLAGIQESRRPNLVRGENDFAVLRNIIAQNAKGAATFSYEKLNELARAAWRRLLAGEEVSLDDVSALPGVVDLAPFAGANDLEKMTNYLVVTEPGFSALDPAEQKTRAQTKLEQMQSAIDEAGAEADVPNDDPSLVPEAQALRNLETRDPQFRALTNDAKFMGRNRDRLRREADRVREHRLRAAEDEQSRLLAATGSNAEYDTNNPPPTSVERSSTPYDGGAGSAVGRTPSVASMPARELPSAAELRTYPGARGVAIDLARVVTWMTTRNQTFSLHPWETQLSMATPVLRAIMAREPNAFAAAGGM